MPPPSELLLRLDEYVDNQIQVSHPEATPTGSSRSLPVSLTPYCPSSEYRTSVLQHLSYPPSRLNTLTHQNDLNAPDTAATQAFFTHPLALLSERDNETYSESNDELASMDVEAQLTTEQRSTLAQVSSDWTRRIAAHTDR